MKLMDFGNNELKLCTCIKVTVVYNRYFSFYFRGK